MTYIHHLEEIALLDFSSMYSRYESLNVSAVTVEEIVTHLEVWHFGCPVVERAAECRVRHDVVDGIQSASQGLSLEHK
jgi:hypothetical protein